MRTRWLTRRTGTRIVGCCAASASVMVSRTNRIARVFAREGPFGSLCVLWRNRSLTVAALFRLRAGHLEHHRVVRRLRRRLNGEPARVLRPRQLALRAEHLDVADLADLILPAEPERRDLHRPLGTSHRESV